MAKQSADNKIQMPKVRQGIPTIYGIIVMVAVLIGVVAMFIFIGPSPDLLPTPLITIKRSEKTSHDCVAGGNCAGPTVSAQDPEGDDLTYKFYDKATGQQVGEMTAPSGEPVTPKFTFDSSGDKELYMVVEDGSGHTSQDYPIIIPVK